jgi:hypothetical protein
MEVPMRWLTSIDLSKMSRGAGMEVSGLVGFEVLRQTEFKIDYRDGLVNIVRGEKFGAPKNLYGN